jgi:hypothetical protein
MFSAPPLPAEIRREDFARRWYFSDDGWLGTLAAGDGQQLTGTFASDRFGEDYQVTGQAGVAGPHSVRLAIHDFNWMPEQHYEGHLSTAGPVIGSNGSDTSDDPGQGPEPWPDVRPGAGSR